MLIDWFTVVAQLVNFLILVFLLKHFLYKPILKAIEVREAKIAAKISDAEEIQLNAKRKSDELKSKISDIDKQRTVLLDQAREQADTEREKLLQEARAAAQAFKKESIEQQAREEKNTQDFILQESQKQVFAIARKVLNDLSGVALEAQIVESFIQRLAKLKEKESNKLSSELFPADSPGIVRSSWELSKDQKSKIEAAISKSFPKKVLLKFEVDSALLSGVELSINGQKLAWSINSYLATMETELFAKANSEKFLK